MSKELKDWIEEQYFQLLCNGHTRDRAKQLILDGRKNKILNKKINLNIPVILLHGLQDKVVPLKISKKTLKIFTKAKKTLIKIKHGDHSLSKINDLKKVVKVLNV